jgi:hypothetical protein
LDSPYCSGCCDRWLGIAHYCAGEWQEAVTETENAIKLSPILFHTALFQAAANAHLGRDEEAKVAAQFFRRAAAMLGVVFTPRYIMQSWDFKDREVADSFEEDLKRAGLFDQGPEYIHVSKEDQITGEDLKTFFFPSKFVGFTADGTQFSQEVSKDGTVTDRASYVPGGVDTGGKSWLEGDTIWVKIPKLYGDLASCRTFFKNPKGTPQGKDEYVYFTDMGMSTFSLVQ